MFPTQFGIPDGPELLVVLVPPLGVPLVLGAVLLVAPSRTDDRDDEPEAHADGLADERDGGES